MFKLSFILLIFLFTFTTKNYGQKTDLSDKIELTVISQVNQGNSYITFPTDIGNLEPLWFEGNIIPNFYLRQSQNSRLMGVLTPQIIIRMYQEESFPVRTPSYIPQITLYYLLQKKNRARTTTLFGRFAHHSNGQDGNFYLEDGNVNIKSGNFSTNFFEAGIIKTNFNEKFNAYQFFKTTLEIHPQSWSCQELEGIYSPVRWISAFSIFKLSNKNTDRAYRPADISMKGEAIWQFGKVNHWNPTSLNRLNLSFTFYYHPKFLEDIGLFVQYYHGLDYYNIYFSHQLNMLRFGIMTEKLRF